MIRSILVGISGSRFSRAAADYAFSLARKYQAKLLGVGIVDVPRLLAPEPVPLGAGAFKAERDEAVLKAARDRISPLLSEFSQRASAAGIGCRTQLAEGDPAEILVTESQRADLLVVGKKHLPQEEWEGSAHTLQSILHHTARPVLCVPEPAEAAAAALIAYDGSLQAAKALQLFVANGLAGERELHLLVVADDGQPIAGRAVEFLTSHGLAVQPHVEAGDHAADRILHWARATSAGIVVMGAYGRPRLREFIFGSVTRSILRQTTVPLFLYH
jgi:nucleotide-binding universal stress UspA family protein